MTFRRRRFLISIPALALLAGCASAPPGGDAASSAPPPYAPLVSESYVIQRAPVEAPYYDYAPPARTYAPAEIFEVTVAEDAQREAEAQRIALAQLQRQADARRVEGAIPTFGVLAPSEDRPDPTALAEARATAAEAEAASLAAELAKAREAVARAEAAAREADSAAQRAVRERVAELAAERGGNRDEEREQAATRPGTRANPAIPPRPVLGRFATRPATPSDARAAADPPAPRAATPPREAPAARPAPPPRPVVERGPIPGLKPYILARSALPSAKPRRAPPRRAFDIGTPSSLSSPVIASVSPLDVSIPREPGDLSTRFFPTPGKPSTMGTDRDSQLDLASIDAVPYGVGAEVREVIEGDSTTADWADAVSLIENGEVEALAIMEDADLVLTLCSGRSILTTPPDLAAAATLTAPQIICGQNKPLELR